MNRYLLLAGRILIASLFVAGAVAKAATFDATSEQLARFGFGGPNFLLTSVIAFELAAGALLGLGLRTRTVAWTLGGYVALITVLVHRDFALALNMNFALSNLAIIGGLIGIAGQKAPPFSLDERRMRETANMARGELGQGIPLRAHAGRA
ncbi:MAG: DoxX family protein [Myxococcales bacterium]